ncbi:hypothetical protein L3C95_20265 [Chitinophaga filiformis]|uniref:hypothetical protein n=1 Tax=Chitinophaga filiformis TaxID=104663 RepID=UPI001F3DD411|nr:hypothetical protein [Chitinophaga filiformis]MCF6405250.1 hypothetical protein [Chitinophaga filiformis]
MTPVIFLKYWLKDDLALGPAVESQGKYVNRQRLAAHKLHLLNGTFNAQFIDGLIECFVVDGREPL